MQIPKFLLMICVAALGLSTLQAQRVDTEEQAKARESLRKKMAELDAQPPAAQPPQISQPAPEPPAPPKKAKVQKAAPKPATVVAPAPTQQFPNRNPADVPPLVPPAKPALTEGTTPLTPEAEAKAREDMRRKISELSPSKSTPPTTATAPAPKAPAKPAVARKKEKKSEQNVFVTPAPTAPVESPIPAAVPGSKNQKLAELLTLYRSNAITPEEYHKKRAEILAQP